MYECDILNVFKQMYENRIVVIKDNCIFETSCNKPLRFKCEDFFICKSVYSNVIHNAIDYDFGSVVFYATISYDFMTHTIKILTVNQDMFGTKGCKIYFSEVLNSLDKSFLIGERID